MALQFSSACSSVFSHRRFSNKIRAVASEEIATPITGDDEKLKLGSSDLKVTRLGIGAWSWGDTSYWNNFEWDDRKMKAAKTAFDASVDNGITFFDTAEVYGSRFSFGAINSETLLGRFIKERKQKDPGVEVAVATKFAALPWRLGRQSVIAALKDSLNRLELSSVELYQLHWPGIWGNEGYIDGLGDAVEQGLVKAVGVSNYSEKRLRDAYKRLKKRGIPLASNQVNYSLIYRSPEENGVKAACDELGVTLIAYSPIAQGALTGKYTPENPPSGPRGNIYTPEFLTKLQPLLRRMSEIGEKYSKTSTQVALNWLVAQENVVPIPGAKNADQAKEFAGAVGWMLSGDEVDELRTLASEIKPVIGFPVEKLIQCVSNLQASIAASILDSLASTEWTYEKSATTVKLPLAYFPRSVVYMLKLLNELSLQTICGSDFKESGSGGLSNSPSCSVHLQKIPLLKRHTVEELMKVIFPVSGQWLDII